MPTFLQVGFPTAAIGPVGSTVSLSSLLSDAFGDNAQYISGAWLAYYGAPTLQEWNFQYWNMAAQSLSTWQVNGSTIPAATSSNFNQTYVAANGFSNVSVQIGNNIMPNLYMTVRIDRGNGDFVYNEFQLSSVSMATPNMPAEGHAPTAAQLVATASSMAMQFPNTANNNDCGWITAIVAAATGAPVPAAFNSIIPAENKEGGFWRIAYRGVPNQNWEALTQPGDIVRFDWADPAQPQHTTMIIGQLQPDGRIEVYDNGDYRNGVSYIGRHMANYDAYSVPASVTIFRLTTDDLFLIATTDNPETVLGTTFNDKILAGGGDDIVRGEIGNDFIDGGAGNDAIYGGAGLDTARFVGAGSDFRFTYNAATKVLTVTDRAGAASAGFDNGTDQLNSVEFLQFDNRTIATAALIGPVKDFNADGFSDIVWRNDAGAAQIWNMNGGNLVGTGSLGNIPADWKIVGAGDFNADGKEDLLWRSDSTAVAQIWKMNNGTILSAYSLGVIPSTWKVLDIGDFNADGLSDILWRNESNGVTQIWNMENGTILDIQNLGVIPPAWKFAGSGDVNGDLKSDLLWRNDSTGVVQLWTMDNGTILNAYSLGAIPANWKIEGVADFNGDDKSDLLWRNDSNGATQIWNMDSATIQSTRSLGNIPSNWQVGDVADYTGDNTADILWRNTTTGVAQLWEMDDGVITGAQSLGVVPNNWHVIA